MEEDLKREEERVRTDAEENAAIAEEGASEDRVNVLFRAESPLSEKQAHALADYTSRKTVPILSAFIFLACAILSVFGFLDGDLVYGIALLVCGAAVAVVMLFVLPAVMRKNTVKSLIYRGAVNTFTVSGEQMEVITRQNGSVVSSMQVPVASLAKVVDFKGSLLLYFNGAQACIVETDGFSVGTAESFLGFCASRGVRVIKISSKNK